jgi:purine-nucleoside phosphorylase
MTTISGTPADLKAHEHDPYGFAIESANTLRPALHGHSPLVGIVLGSGLGGLVDHFTNPHVIPYSKIRYFPQTTVEGHAGRLVVGQLGGVPVVALQGRIHLYEGYRPADVVHPIRVLGLLGIQILIVTNTAGGLDPTYQAGDLMLICDHIGLPTLAGNNPLMGLNRDQFGPRFPPMTYSYDGELLEHARAVGAELGITLREGVYMMVAGPSYETPAELTFLRRTGADAVGMSTVPEVIAARHMDIRVLGISCITNVALPAGATPPVAPSHEEVVAAAREAGDRFAALVGGVLERVGRQDQPGDQPST